jgi:transketolase
MRAALSDALVRLAKANPNVLLLTGDHGYALFDAFRRECGSQYYNLGIAEQNMIGVAAGLSRAGFLPICYGLAAFVPVRVLEQIKIDLCHDNLPAILLGDGAGFVYSALGTSHQSCEDIACIRAVPQITILSPCDRFELAAAMDYAAISASPIYLRVGKADLGDVHAGPATLTPGRLLPVVPGQGGIAFIATGSMVRPATQLVEQFPGASVWSAPFLKPVDKAQVAEIAAVSDHIVTLEEHSVYGGLGAIMAEIVSTYRPKPLLRIGVADRFSHYCGTYKYLLQEHGLDLPAITGKVRDFLALHGA